MLVLSGKLSDLVKRQHPGVGPGVTDLVERQHPGVGPGVCERLVARQQLVVQTGVALVLCQYTATLRSFNQTLTLFCKRYM